VYLYTVFAGVFKEEDFMARRKREFLRRVLAFSFGPVLLFTIYILAGMAGILLKF
jgi:hypothetical protein